MADVETTDPVVALKDRHRAVWTAGDYGGIAQLVRRVGEHCVAAADIRSGQRVLDVACGTGNATIPAARAGAEAVGLDLVARLVDEARARAEREGVQAEFMVGDAEALPFADAEFDHVLSAIGIQFAPRHDVVAGELARVLRPGGRLTLCNWRRDGIVGRLFKLMAEYQPAPPPFASPPPMWGDEEHVRGLLAPHGIEVEFEPAECVVEYSSIAEFMTCFETEYGPSLTLKGMLETKGLYEGYRARWEEMLREFARPSDHAEIVHAYYVIRGRKAA